MEKGLSHSHRDAARHCSRSLCSCFASTWLDQIRHLHGYSALILVQAAGWRRPIRSTWLIGLPFGTALGILYSVTTISGPPLAILFNNQGLVKSEFRAGLALVRVAESSVTAIVYYQLGLFIAESQNILLVFAPSVVLGVPLGAYLIRRLDAETFRRISMSFDAWIVGFGFSRVLIDLNLMESPWAYSVLAVTILIDTYLLYVFFTVQKAASKRFANDDTN